MNLENELRAALRRESPPPDFAAAVLARTRIVPWWRRPATFALAAGLVLAALIPPAVSEYQRRQRQRGLEAREHLITALAITKAQLRQAKEKLRQNTRSTL